MSKILVLGSGGMKTLLLAAAAQKEGTPIICYLNFGLPNSQQEIRANEQIASFTDADLQVLTAPEGLLLTSNPASMVTFFCWLLNHALRLECSILYHGLSKEDYGMTGQTVLTNESAVEQFYTTVSTLFTLLQPNYTQSGSFIGHSAIELPLYKLTRRLILRLGNSWYLPWDLTWSCVTGNVFHCGKCHKCQARRSAFVYENFPDPTTYQR